MISDAVAARTWSCVSGIERLRLLVALAVSTTIALVVSLAVQVPFAQAATHYNHVGKFGGTGTTDGLFRNNPMPQRIAVHEQSGKIFVADRGNNRIQVFDRTPTAAAFALSIPLTAPVSVAIDQANGALYASTSTAIHKFLPDQIDDPDSYSPDPTFTSPTVGALGDIGALQAGAAAVPSQGGLAVDPTDSTLLVADVGRNLVQRFESDGSFDSSFDGAGPGRSTFTGIYDIAVSGAGDVIVADVSGANGRVDRFDRSGALLATLSVNNDPVPNPKLNSSFGKAGISIAADRVTGEVYVSSVTGDVLLPDVTNIYQFEDDAFVRSFTAPSDMVGFVHGMTVSSASPGRLYVMAGSTPTGFGVLATPYVQVFEALAPPTLSIDAVTAITATTAELSGTVNPNGSAVNWTFKYRRVGDATWKQAPETPEDGGSGTDDVPVDATVTGLEPNSEYEVKLLVSTGSVEAESGTVTFTTEPAEPLLDVVGATFKTSTAVTLTGGINPRNAGVSYYFEWGTDTDYGQIVPIPDGQLQPGPTRVTVTERIEGLTPGETYHFRLVATNEFDQPAESDDLSFTTLTVPRSGLPPARGHEVVSQLPSNGVAPLPGSSIISDDGNRATYGTAATEPFQPGDTPNRQFVGVRDDDGWQLGPIDLPNPGEYSFGEEVAPSKDLTRFFGSTSLALHPEDHNDALDLYRIESDGRRTWITRSELVEPGEPQLDNAFLGVFMPAPTSRDGSVIAFTSQRRLIEADPFPSGSTQHSYAAARLYKYSDAYPGIGIRLLSVLPNGTPVSGFGDPLFVSDDGSRVIWRTATNAVGANSKLYIQIDGRPNTLAAGDGALVKASPDASRLIVLDGSALYYVDGDTGARKRIDSNASVRDAMAVSDDAMTVYFASDSALTAGGSPLGRGPAAGAGNVYRVLLDEEGDVVDTTLVASVGTSGGGADWSATSPDGSVLAFGTATTVTGEPTGGHQQLFVYDDKARSLSCVSCPRDGSAPAQEGVNRHLTRSANVTPQTGWYGGYVRQEPRRFVSEDGTVFFSTRASLVPEDRNSVRDVYEYRGGDIRLLSRGGWDDAPVMFEGVSRDGRTAFISTSSVLDPLDNEPGVYKLYAVRVGGGFPPPDPPAPGCDADDCQGEPASPPRPPVIGTISFGGDANVVSEKPQAATAVRVARLKSLGAVARLRVRTPGAGRVLVSGQRIRRTAKRSPRGGVLTLRVALKPRLRKALRQRKRLRAAVRLIYRSGDGQTATKTLRIVFRQTTARRTGASRRGR